MPKQVKKKQEEKKSAIVERQKYIDLIFKTQSMKTSLNSYAVLLKIYPFFFCFFLLKTRQN